MSIMPSLKPNISAAVGASLLAVPSYSSSGRQALRTECAGTFIPGDSRSSAQHSAHRPSP